MSHARRIGACVIFAIIVAAPALGASTPDSDVAPLSFCSFGPKMKVFVPATSPGSPEGERDGHCPAPVQVQGIQWECLQKEKTEQSVDEFRLALQAHAKEECDSYCKGKSTGASCTGRLDVSQVCGLQTRSVDAVNVGKKLGCRVDCPGQAMAFCSIYNADFTSGSAEALAGQPPNCHCAPSSR